MKQILFLAILATTSLWGEGIRVQVLDAPDKDVSYSSLGNGQGMYTFLSNDAVIGIEGLVQHPSQETVIIETNELGSRLEIGSPDTPSDQPLFSWSVEGLILSIPGEGSSLQFYRGFDGSKSTKMIEICSQTIILGQEGGKSSCDVILIGGTPGVNVCIGDPLGNPTGSPAFAAYSGEGNKNTGIWVPHGFLTLESPTWTLQPVASILLDASGAPNAGHCILSSGKNVSLLVDRCTLQRGPGKHSCSSIIVSKENSLNLAIRTALILSDQAGCRSRIYAEPPGNVLLESCDGQKALLCNEILSPTNWSFSN